MADGYYDRNREERIELIEGLLREGELAAFAGPFGMGKSPLFADLTVRFIHGLEWCGRRVARRPVTAIDCETPGPDYKKAIIAIADRLKVPVPSVPDELDIYLERDDLSEASTSGLLSAITLPGHTPKLQLIEKTLRQKPNAVVLVDPLEMLFRLDTCKKPEVLLLYRQLRMLLAGFPHAAIMMTFNLRKKDKKNGRADLLSDPRDWLEEVCGTLDILNRCDVRLGIDAQGEDVRVINGIVRGREMHPILIRPFTMIDGRLAGFERVSAGQGDLLMGLSNTQMQYWKTLPPRFTFPEIADKLVPRSSLSRLINTACSLGALVRGDDGCFSKVD
jgi:AAA domain